MSENIENYRSKPRGLFIREAFGCLFTYGPKTSLVVNSSNLLVTYLMNLDFTRELGVDLRTLIDLPNTWETPGQIVSSLRSF